MRRRGVILFDLDNTLIDRDRAAEVWLAGRDPAVIAPADLRAGIIAHLVPDPEIIALIDRLEAEAWRLGVVTNGGGDTQRSKLRSAGLERFLGSALISGEIGAAKPSAEVFRRALATHRAGTALFVGDDPIADIAGARAVGLRTCWVSRGRTFPKHTAPPDLTIERVTSLEDVLC